MSSSIVRIVDYTAQRAALVPGMRAVFGSGQGVIGDPLRPGATIAPCPERPTEPLTHWSKMPDAPSIEWVSMQSVELHWTIPMTLWIERSDAATAAQVSLPFYSGYLDAFLPDPTLSGLAMLSWIRSFKPGADDEWFWLDVELEVQELVTV